jgi:hypothetical protein
VNTIAAVTVPSGLGLTPLRIMTVNTMVAVTVPSGLGLTPLRIITVNTTHTKAVLLSFHDSVVKVRVP